MEINSYLADSKLSLLLKTDYRAFWKWDSLCIFLDDPALREHNPDPAHALTTDSWWPHKLILTFWIFICPYGGIHSGNIWRIIGGESPEPLVEYAWSMSPSLAVLSLPTFLLELGIIPTLSGERCMLPCVLDFRNDRGCFIRGDIANWIYVFLLITNKKESADD